VTRDASSPILPGLFSDDTSYQLTESTYAVPIHVAFVVNSTPSSLSGVWALAGTRTVIVFHAPAIKLAIGTAVPVKTNPASAPCCTNGCTSVIGLPAGIQTWNVTRAPAGGKGPFITSACVVPAGPLKSIASDSQPANASAVDIATPVIGAPLPTQRWTNRSKLYWTVSAPPSQVEPASMPELPLLDPLLLLELLLLDPPLLLLELPLLDPPLLLLELLPVDPPLLLELLLPVTPLLLPLLLVTPLLLPCAPLLLPLLAAVDESAPGPPLGGARQ
jgi:hypothetical protein